MFHHHTAEDPIRHAAYEITSHADPKVALLVASNPAGEGGAERSLYIHQDDVPGAVVALLTNTAFLKRAPADEHEALMLSAAADFIDAFREAMVPTFRERFQTAMDEATSDWDLKCRMAEVINDYENLR